MKQSRVSAFARVVRWSGRFGRVAVLAAVALVLGAGSLLAQGSTGKLEGRVRDQAGAPIANAQVVIVGTAFNATTNNQGYYFINNVPAGVLDVRAQFVGYRPMQVSNVRMLAGQTITQDITMEQSAVQITELVVTEAVQPLVPRDEVTTKQRISGEFTDKLPVDRINAMLALQPGVAASASGAALTVRGGRTDENATYVDGVPVQAGNRGTGYVFAGSGGGSGNISTAGGGASVATAAGGGFVGTGGTELTAGTNALEEASITTGASSAEFGNAQGGIISMQTRSGSSQGFSGGLGFETDALFGAGTGLGFNRLQASVGGPTRLIDNLTFFAAGVVEGQKGVANGVGGDENPIFVQAGIDTIVTSATGGPDTVYNFAVARGECDRFANSVNSDIANNYGADCGSIRLPNSGLAAYQFTSKLDYTFGQGSRVALTGLATQTQSRIFNASRLYNPDEQMGQRAWNQALILGWTQNLSRSTERALAVNLNLSYQRDRYVTSPLEDPYADFGALGMQIAPIDLIWDMDNFEVTDELIDNFRTGTGTFIPLLEERTEVAEVDRLRNNAYGLASYYPESGVSAGIRFISNDETRLIAKGGLDWQFDRFNRIRAGGEFTQYDIKSYSAALTSQFFSDAISERPIRWNVYAEDRLDLGDLVLVGGLRYDYYNTNASRPYFTCTAEYDAEDNRPGDGTCGGAIAVGDRQLYPRVASMPGFDPENPTAHYVADEGHGYLSPHVQVSFPVTDRTNFRLSYAHQVQAPDFGLTLSGINTDLAVTNTNQVYGTDLNFGRSITFEFGVRHAFSDDMVLDVAAYNKDNLANAAGRLIRLYDPVARSETDIRVVQNADFGNARGIDVRLDRRIGNLFNGTVSYSYQSAKNTGTDPFTYINFGSRVINELAGGNQPPPQAIAPTATSRPHTLAMAAALTFPNDWQDGSTLGKVLENTGLFATMRYQSGTGYTECDEASGNEAVISGQVCGKGGFSGGLNTARLPSFKSFDLRVTRGFNVGGIGATAYVDARNLLDFRNVLAVFVQTRDITNEADFRLQFAGDSLRFFTDASENGIYDDATGAIDLTFGGAGTAGCGGFVNGDGDAAVADCVYLIRAEERFGDGDGVFSVAEQQAVSRASYNAIGRGADYFTGAGRRLRVGLELNF